MKPPETRNLAKANEKRGERLQGARQYLGLKWKGNSGVKVGLDQQPYHISQAKEPGWQSVGGHT